ncbi:MAG: NAD+ synthase [Phycisphaerae bacterium]|nr:NAD+ synthase [Phycisphaerae bacterium]
MKLALVQFNPVVGDVSGNARRVAEWVERAKSGGAELVVFPELALTGYPPRDLLHQEGFLEAARDAAVGLAAGVRGVTVMAGCPWRESGTTNSVLVMRDGEIIARYDKRLLPTYDVFDEDRYFEAGDRPLVVEASGVRVGVSVCEDLWKGADVGSDHRYRGRGDPVGDLVASGASLIVNPSASPFVLGKGARQRAILTRHVERHGVAVAAVNQVGGNDDLIFDGHAAVFVPGDSGARLVAAGPGFEEAVVLVDVPSDGRWSARAGVDDPLRGASDESLLFRALVLGVRDYCRKTGFRSCVLGLSGGIDSALTACIASAALGADRVLGIGLPSRYSSAGSVEDARALAENLGMSWRLMPIDGPHAAVEASLGAMWRSIGASAESGVTEENVQSRVRGLLLMAVSNKTGAILLTTGNKSELAVGYCTLYGDMNGGLAVLSDVTKEQVYRLSRWINAEPRRAGFASPPIPEASITKAPSAELRPNQTDQDSLPPYEMLDEIIERYVEGRQCAARIERETGFDSAIVRRIVRLIDTSEYKRRQMATGLKVTGLTFGPGRRWPIAQGYRG